MFFVLLAALFLGLLALSPWLLRGLIRRRLRGYRCAHNAPDMWLPEKLDGDKSAVVVGAGVAGLTAALTLARRGFHVTVLEKNSYVGGKLGSWKVDLGQGRQAWVSHGFHAFFRHYYNLNRFLDSLRLRRKFRSVGDYVILGRSGQVLRFANLATTPVFNLISLMRAGMFAWRDALAAPGRDLYGVFLEYEQKRTFETFDQLSYGEFARLAQVPPRLKLAFNTFARAFFSDEDKLSFAELIKSFHFYYLSHDGGLVYDYPVEDYEDGILKPLRDEIELHGGRIITGQAVDSLFRDGERYTVNGNTYDKLIVASDVKGTAAMFQYARGFVETKRQQLAGLRAGQRYAVLRLWLDRDVREGLPIFVITEKLRVLDSVTTYHRFEKEAKQQLELSFADGEKAKSILELHCYSVPDEMPDHLVQQALFDELLEFFPELEGSKQLGAHFQLRDDFTAFHVGLDESRPTVETGMRGFYCAGDWVKLPFPAMLLECACASGLLAANGVLREHGLREELIETVPLHGLMAGVKAPPARKRLLENVSRV